MRKIILGVVAAILLPISVAFADVSADMANGLSLNQILTNAATDGVELSEVVSQIIAINPEMAEAAVLAAITIDPMQAATVVVAAITALPEKSIAIADAASKAAPKQAENIKQAIQVANIQANIEGTTGDVVTEDTAAGNPNAATPATPATPADPAISGIPGSPAFPATPAIPNPGNGGGGSPS